MNIKLLGSEKEYDKFGRRVIVVGWGNIAENMLLPEPAQIGLKVNLLNLDR